MLIATTIGSVVGVISGYYGGKTSAILMRVVDAFLSFPSVFLLLALAAFIQPGPVRIALIISATSWMEVARIVESEVKSLRNDDFVQAAHLLGLSNRWIMFRELLPNAIGPIIVAATLTVARAILLEAYVSFLGYGI
jgi:peptide/nickel transport system permease protein